MEIWQPGFHEQTIRDGRDLRSKVEYIRMNPVVAKLVGTAEQWPYSSVRPEFHMDEPPANVASGAKAPVRAQGIVGAKAPTP
jgi:hypothetical protein